jgi:L-2-hydroxyglutarate oxidase LhgO
MMDDLLVIGGGIVGLASALEWTSRFPDDRVTLLEKEPRVGRHQTGHNSGVLHSGIYYRPGSLKARTCVEGAARMLEFCRTHQIPHQVCGKVVVAAREDERPGLQRLYERGLANGVAGLALIGPERLRELEPNARGVAALHVPGAGLVDYGTVAETMARLLEARGVQLRRATRVRRLMRREGAWLAQTTAGDYRAGTLIVCGGLHADRLSGAVPATRRVQIVPFRGEYYDVVPQRRDLVRGMVYPVPDPAVPFLGVHLTRTIAGGLHAGPNAVLALKREGYKKTDIDAQDLLQMVRYSGWWKMAARYWRTGLEEAWRSWSKRAFVRALQRLVPAIQASDLVPGSSGVRAQAVGQDGRLLDDFDLLQGERAVFVRNVPSPAATACLSIARAIVDSLVSDTFQSGKSV